MEAPVEKGDTHGLREQEAFSRSPFWLQHVLGVALPCRRLSISGLRTALRPFWRPF